MGAEIITPKMEDCAPLEIRGGKLHAIDYTSPIPSAQVKSAILLAGLFAEGVTTVRSPSRTRDHTELALRRVWSFESPCCVGGQISIHRRPNCQARQLIVSRATFLPRCF